MILIVTRADGTEETYEVPPRTKLRVALRGEVWFFRSLSGGEFAISNADIIDVKLGNVELSARAPEREED